MSDDVPQIPMPEYPDQPGDSTPPPEGGFTRELTPAEKREALVNFMGGQYGEMHKMDQAIIGTSSTLTRGKSEEVKQQITQVLQQPIEPVAPQPSTPQPAPVPTPPVQDQAVPTPQQPVNDNQLTFNFDTNEKDILFDKINKLTSRVDSLHHKIDKIFEIVNTKRSTKKKSVE